MFELIQNGDFVGLREYVVIRVSITMVCWFFMVCATLFDFWSGISTARATGEKLMSHGFRRTLAKISDYWRVLLFALMFDVLGAFLSFYYLPFLTMLCTLAIIIIEARSVVENSARRKLNAAKIPDVLKDIKEATSDDDAQKVLASVGKLMALTEKNSRYGKE